MKCQSFICSGPESSCSGFAWTIISGSNKVFFTLNLKMNSYRNVKTWQVIVLHAQGGKTPIFNGYLMH